MTEAWIDHLETYTVTRTDVVFEDKRFCVDREDAEDLVRLLNELTRLRKVVDGRKTIPEGKPQG